MKKRYILLLFVFLYACSTYKDLPAPAANAGWETKQIPAAPQTKGGDPEKGFEYLLTGDYIGSGIPFEIVEKRMLPEHPDKVLKRQGLNERAPYLMTVFEAENGVPVANGNCFTCHAGRLEGKVVIGLGNSFSNYDKNWSLMAKLMNFGVDMKYNKKSEEWAAYQPFGKFFRKMTPYIETEQRGVNPAAMLAEACARHRDPVTLEYVDEPNYEMPRYAIATDVPPLWNVRKKNALYYTAVGRGDFTKLLFQASVLGIPDSAAARRAVTNFKDVVAWLNSLEPPEYPKEVDQTLAARGELLFNEHCADCHGTYGKWDSYPNKVVSLDVVKTDPLYASYAVQAPIVDWYNDSWFATSEPESHFEPEAGYIAPPLDGIWATAPFLHNGSVPTLDALLDSKSRPTYWERSGDNRDYNYEKVGWNYTERKNGRGKWTYDTTGPGYSNEGHYFGDKLKEEERRAVIEYLKTL